MAIIAYPLNNIDYTAEDAMLANLPTSSGVYAAENNLDISISSGLKVSISRGLAFIRYATAKGFTVYIDDPTVLTFDPADTVLSRIDRVVLQWVESENKVSVVIKKGTPASKPTPIERSATESVYELVLYDVKIDAGATALSFSAITDQRMNSSLCGLMANTITKLDTSTYEAQIKAIIENAESKISTEISTQLQEAKDSGEFKGDKGDTGAAGANGYTPQRGVDYWTSADQTAIVNAVLANFTDVSEVAM